MTHSRLTRARRALALLTCTALAGARAPATPLQPTLEALHPALEAAHPTLAVGTLELERCPHVHAYCGHIERPLDPTGAVPGSLSIHFEYYPHTASRPSVGTLVATEGGPGYATTESRADYLALFEPLRNTHDIVLMDNRGTGESGAIDCPALQSAGRWTVELIGACGRSLGPKAALYGTAYATDDLAEILTQLGTGPIDLYGDSYGTYFEQVFALRHPDRLRSIVLDGAYPLTGPDYAWYPSYAPAMREKFDRACSRFPPCAAIPGSSLEHIEPALERLRAAPFAARAPDSAGVERSFTADASMLATVMFAASPALATTRETDAAARAFVAGDRVPLLRLMAETALGVDSRDATANPTVWSAGLSALVMCHDPPQIFDMRLAPAARAADRDRALAERRRTHPDSYAPFTIDEFRGMPLDYSFLDQCLDWPVAPAAHPAATVTPLDAPYPAVPALVISGEFDDITTPADGAAVAAAFPRGRQVLIANSFHVNALPRARSRCAAGIVRRFIARLDPGDTGCAAEVPALRLVPRFARTLDELEPAAPLAGNAASGRALRAVATALLTAGDVLARAPRDGSARGPGLRGGWFQCAQEHAATRIELRSVRFTDDLSVSGSIRRLRDDASTVQAHLTIQGPDALAGRIEARWQDAAPAAQATIHGVIGGSRVAAQMTAP